MDGHDRSVFQRIRARSPTEVFVVYEPASRSVVSEMWPDVPITRCVLHSMKSRLKNGFISCQISQSTRLVST